MTGPPQRRALPYGRPPIPTRRTLDLLAAGRRDEAAILLLLYARSNWRPFQEGRVPYLTSGPFSLKDIAAGIGWLVGVPRERTDARMKWLSKLLRRLWREGDLRYDSTPGRRGDRYQFRLYPVGGGEAEEEPPRRRRKPAAEGRSGSRVAPPADSVQAEEESPRGGRGGRRRGVPRRRTEEVAKSHEERISAVLGGDAGGGVQTFTESPRPSGEGGPPGVPHLEGRTREGGPGGEGSAGASLREVIAKAEALARAAAETTEAENEKAVLAEVAELVEEGVLVPIDTDEEEAE